MTQHEVASIVKGIGAAVLVHVGKSLDEFSERIARMEQRVSSVRDGEPGQPGIVGPQGEKGERGEIGPAGAHGTDGVNGAPGRDVDETQILALVDEVKVLRDELLVLKAAPATTLEAVEAPDVEVLVKSAVAEAVAQIPAPKDGRDGQDGTSVTVDELRPVVASAISEAVSALPAPKDGAPGRDVDMDDVEALVIKAVSHFKQPHDGTSVTVEDVRPLIAGEVEKAVAAIPLAKDGKDGIGVFGGVIDRENHLVLTFSDGTVKDFGPVVGRDGRDVDMADVELVIKSEVAKFPQPKDGVNGKDGVDGVGFDDLNFVSDERGCFLTFTRGEQRKEFRLPIVIDRGVFKSGTTYPPGSGVTWAGSFWIAQKETDEKPGEGVTWWRLAVKRGGIGATGAKGADGINGKDGAPGRDGMRSY